MFANPEWESHFEAMASGAPLLYSSSSSVSTVSSESEVSDSEDSVVPQNANPDEEKNSMEFDTNHATGSGVFRSPARKVAHVKTMQDVEEDDPMETDPNDPKRLSGLTIGDESQNRFEPDTDDEKRLLTWEVLPGKQQI